MKYKLLIASALLLSLFSCKDDQEISPMNELNGEWEFTMEKVGNDYELDFVDRLVFKPDGEVYGEGLTTNTGTDQLLGYRYYFNGKYEVADGKVIIKEREMFNNVMMDSFFSPKDELIYLEEDYGSDSYLIKGNYSELQIICPPNANCLNIIFTKNN